MQQVERKQFGDDPVLMLSPTTMRCHDARQQIMYIAQCSSLANTVIYKVDVGNLECLKTDEGPRTETFKKSFWLKSSPKTLKISYVYSIEGMSYVSIDK